MDIDLIRAFCMLAKHANYRIAADHLCITQSALTKKIQRLEDRIGSLLFERGRQGAQLTSVGRTLLPEANRLVNSFTHFQGLTKSVTEGTEGHLNIGFGISTYFTAPAIIADFKKQYPKVHITLNDLPSSRQLDELLDGNLHVSFNRLPVIYPLTGLKLFADKLVLAVHYDEFVDINDPLQSLAKQTYLALNLMRGPGLHSQIQRYLATNEYRLTPEQESDDILTLLALVSSRIGYTIIPESAKNISHSKVRFVPLKGKHSSWDVGLIWNEASIDPVRREFIALASSKIKPEK